MSEPYFVSDSLKQGCVLAPILFILIFFAMLTDGFRGGDLGIGIGYQTQEASGKT